MNEFGSDSVMPRRDKCDICRLRKVKVSDFDCMNVDFAELTRLSAMLAVQLAGHVSKADGRVVTVR